MWLNEAKLIVIIYRTSNKFILKIYIRTLISVILFAFIFATVHSCSKQNGVEKDVSSRLNTDTIKTFLALGDSYTIGEAVADTERFPNQTIQLLKNEDIHIGDPKIIAITGWSTGDLINALNLEPLQSNYSIVTLLIGVNNQYQHRSIDEYKKEFTLLLNRSITYAANNKSHVFVLSIPDYSVTPFARNSDTATIVKEIDAFNSVNKMISLQAGVNYIDITPISKEAATDADLIAPDGLHPSGKQYKRWADLLAAVLIKQKKSL